jgi:hypothetical protein
MNDFEKYLHDLAKHESKKSKSFLDSRKSILVNAGIRLNWLGDFLANPRINYKKKDVAVENILFTGTTPDWNKVLMDKCDRSVKKFQDLIKVDKKIKKKFTAEASFGTEPILMHGPDEKGFYRIFDGMHRFVGSVIENRKTITAYIPTNSKKHLPICEAHTVYDLIRGFERNANDEEGKTELYHALKLLVRTYENVLELLMKRFDSAHISNIEVQKIITKVIEETKK